MGGGGNSGIFPWSQKAYAVQLGGGGVVAEIFRGLENNYAIRWGGVVAQNFSSRDVKTPVFVNGPLLDFFYFPEGGARAPWAPPESATDTNHNYNPNRTLPWP